MGFSVAIIGLGLMGGSFAYALRGFKEAVITGYDRDPDTLNEALAAGAIDRAAASLEEAAGEADLSIFCAYPGAIIEGLHACAGHFKEGAVVTDICGVKAEIMAALPPGIDYVGLHPMAGKEVDGFENAEAGLFRNAGFILIPRDGSSEYAVTLLTELSHYVGAGRVCINTPEEHDNIIGYTSDLMHISASALCRSYPAGMTMAHAAGAFRDCTRIATLNAESWTELLLMNRHNVAPFLDTLIRDLTGFNEALRGEDSGYIREFLKAACDNKKDMIKL